MQRTVPSFFSWPHAFLFR